MRRFRHPRDVISHAIDFIHFEGLPMELTGRFLLDRAFHSCFVENVGRKRPGHDTGVCPHAHNNRNMAGSGTATVRERTKAGQLASAETPLHPPGARRWTRS